MIKLFIIFITILFIIYIFWQRNKKLPDANNTGFYKKLIIIVMVIGVLFFLATSGKFILPQVFSIFKLLLPMITRLIGI